MKQGIIEGPVKRTETKKWMSCEECKYLIDELVTVEGMGSTGMMCDTCTHPSLKEHKLIAFNKTRVTPDWCPILINQKKPNQKQLLIQFILILISAPIVLFGPLYMTLVYKCGYWLLGYVPFIAIGLAGGC